MKKKIGETNFKVLTGVVTMVLILAATFCVILWAKGYRLQKNLSLLPTGQLVLKSSPDAASVFVNGKFVAATPSTLNLPPGEYVVRIIKDGYHPWEKKLKIESEIVTPTDAILFPAVPELRRLTLTGALNPVLSLDGTKIAYGVASSSAYPPKNGVFVMDISEKYNVFFAGGTQFVARDEPDKEFSKGKYLFSPDGKELLVYFEQNNGAIQQELSQEAESAPVLTAFGNLDLTKIERAYLLNADRLNAEGAPDVVLTLEQILSSWEAEKDQSDSALQNSLIKNSLKKVASDSMQIKSFTVDGSKFIYQARKDAILPQIIKPAIAGANSTPEQRNLVSGKLYIYDIKEDKNYPVAETEDKITPLWLATSRHYLTWQKGKVFVTEYDGTNKITLFDNLSDESFIAPSPSGNKIVFLLSISPNLPLNLYGLLMR